MIRVWHIPGYLENAGYDRQALKAGFAEAIRAMQARAGSNVKI
jgi:hypothetical protein